MVRKISAKIPNEQLKQDLEKYRQRALELGATDAKTITTNKVVIDERVRAKCIYPKCDQYGTNAQCPPHAMDLDMVRKIVKNFRYGIFTRLEVPSENIAGREAQQKGAFGRPHLKTHEIVSKIEAEAFFDGYHLALGFACGPCKALFCFNQDCAALVPGKACRHPLRARSSMEGVGMDVFTMAAIAGWPIYPIGASSSPADVPCGGTYGLILIH
jgi:predicted metal-binding protein